MSPRTTKQLKEIREEKRALIMNAALKLFAEEGYYITSIDKIAKAANISKGLVYNYFESKEHLLSEIFQLGFDEIFQFFDPNHDGVLTKEELIWFIDKSVEELKRNPDFWKLYFILAMKPSVYKIFKKNFTDFIVPVIDMMVAYFRDNGSKEPEAEARLVVAILDGVGMHYVLDPENYPMDNIKEILKKKYI